MHPTLDGALVTSPTILTYSPYSILGRNNDADHWVARGYARAYADVVGTGNSGGCYDYGGRREKQTGYDIVEWIADRAWSNGKIGMIGGSYEGTTATATATQRPPHLTTIVPEAAIVRWYDYAYSGGIRYFLNSEALGHQGPGSATDEGFDTPLAFDFGLALPPPVDPGDPDWAERVASTVTPCDELTHTEHGYDSTPDYGAFWRQRDYLRLAGRIDIPVLVAHNWGDWNVKQEEAIRLYRALDNAPSKLLYMGTRWEGHGTPGGTYDAAVDDWFAHYLKGADNGVEDLGPVVSQRNDSEGAAGWYEGRWPAVRELSLRAQPLDGRGYEWQLLPSSPGGRRVATFTSTGTNTESGAALAPRTNASWLYLESPELERYVRVFGSITLRLRSRVERTWVTVTPTVLDVAPDGRTSVGGQEVATSSTSLVAVTRGFLDSRYRDSLARRRPVEPGGWFAMDVVAKPQDYAFRKGHRIGLMISSEIAEWMVPKEPEDCAGPDCTTVDVDVSGGTRLVLPVVRLGPETVTVTPDSRI